MSETDELVEVAAMAIAALECTSRPECVFGETCFCRKAARAVITAVRPKIEAMERARIAEEQSSADERAREAIHQMYVDSGGPTDALRAALDAYEANVQAAAIRDKQETE